MNGSWAICSEERKILPTDSFGRTITVVGRSQNRAPWQPDDAGAGRDQALVRHGHTGRKVRSGGM
jgi:hypothetical protein